MPSLYQPFTPYKMFHGSFIPEWLECRSIKECSTGAKLIYSRLTRYAGKDGKCYPPVEEIAKATGYKKRQIDNILKELKDLKLIKAIRVGKKCSNRYVFLWHPWIAEAIEVPSDTQNSAHHENSDTQNSAHPMDTQNSAHPYKENQERESVTRVFEYWKKVHKHSKAVLDEPRRKKIEKALKNYSIDQILNAIDGCKHSPHNMGKNDRNTVFDDIKIIVKDSSNIERFIALFEQNKNKNSDDWIYY